MSSLEIVSVPYDIAIAADEVAYRVGKILRANMGDKATGVTAEGGAQLGAKVAMEALCRMGLLPAEFDHERFYTELGRLELLALTGTEEA